MANNDLVEALVFEHRDVWRKWLSENHDKEKSIWLKLYKKQSQTAGLSYDEAVDEALCFGWVDSSIKGSNEDYYYQFFARRNPKSNWSKINKAKVEKLIAGGLMAEPGMKIIDFAKENGNWTALDDVDNLINPPDLQLALDSNPLLRPILRHFLVRSKEVYWSGC